MNNDEIDEIVRSKVRDKKKSLMDLSLDDLLRLPPMVVDQIIVEGKPLEILTYRENLPDEKNLVVVQCKNTRFWRYGSIFAEGFIIDKSGGKWDADEKLMWTYL